MKMLSNMHKLKFVFITLLALIYSHHTLAKIFNYQEFQLDNGLKFIIIKNHRAPVVAQMVWYKVGGGDEEKGKSGIAHFLEHLLFKGDILHNGLTFNTITHNIGALSNAFTTKDYTAYYEIAPSNQLKLIMQLESSRMGNLEISNKEIEAERKVVINERVMRTENSPYGTLREQQIASLFMNSPRSIPTIGWKHEIKQLSYSDITDFYHKWYRSNNAIVVLAGDVDLQQAKKLALETYGKLKIGKPVKHNRTIEPQHWSETVVKLKDKKMKTASINQIYISPSASKNIKESLALSIIEKDINSNTGSLYKTLLDKKLITSIESYVNDITINEGTFSLGANLYNKKDIEQTLQIIDNYIKKIKQSGLSKERLKSLKKVMKAEIIYSTDDPMSIASIIGSALATDIDIKRLQYYDEDLDKITNNDIIYIANKVLNFKQRSIGILVDDK